MSRGAHITQYKGVQTEARAVLMDAALALSLSGFGDQAGLGECQLRPGQTCHQSLAPAIWTYVTFSVLVPETNCISCSFLQGHCPAQASHKPHLAPVEGDAQVCVSVCSTEVPIVILLRAGGPKDGSF